MHVSKGLRRVFFVGKALPGKPHNPFLKVGRALGRAAAELDISLIVGSDSAGTLDRAVVEGASEVARLTDRPVHWEVVEAADGVIRFSPPPEGLSPPARH